MSRFKELQSQVSFVHFCIAQCEAKVIQPRFLFSRVKSWTLISYDIFAETLCIRPISTRHIH